MENRSINERKLGLLKQGISSDDLNKAYEDGRS